jgi:predicted HicB family RNase H-like nuclease
MAKKEFANMENPVKQFLSQSAALLPGAAEPSLLAVPAAVHTGKRELKKKRLNLIIQPSLYEDLSKIAYVKKISVNELICQAAKEYRDNEKRALDRYRAFTANERD